jgi:hypothetical protein
MNIAFDLDDVLFPFGEGFFPWHNRMFGTNFRIEDNKSYLMHILLGGTYEDTQRKIALYCGTEDFRNTRPRDGSIELLSRLRRHNKWIVTSRLKTHGKVNLELETRKFVDEYFRGIFNGIVMAESKFFEDKRDRKRKICEELGIEIFVEDCLDYALSCADVCMRVILFDRPWNQAPIATENIIRVHSISEIEGYIS